MFLEGPNCPSPPLDAPGHGTRAHSPAHVSQSTSVTVAFSPQAPVLPHLPRHPVVLCITQTPPGASRSCLQSAAHLPTPLQGPGTHPKCQVLCRCPPVLLHIEAGPVSLHCIFWSSTELQTSKLCWELVFRSASISINDNAELKVLDSDGHLGFYFSLTGTVTRLNETQTQLPSHSRGCNGGDRLEQNSGRRGPLCPLFTTRVKASHAGSRRNNQKRTYCSSIQATPSTAKAFLQEGHIPRGASPLPRPPTAEKKG